MPQCAQPANSAVLPFSVTNRSCSWRNALGKSEPDELVDAVGEKLRGDKVAHYFTGHCTGKEAYERLKRKLGDRLGEMPAGSDFTV